MTSIIEKRRSLHKNLATQKLRNNTLKLQISQLQALANIGATTCMVAHEINNLLTAPATYAALAISNPQDKPIAEKAMQKTVKNCQRAAKILESMLSLANSQENDKQSVRPVVLIEEIFNALGRDFAKDNISVEIQIPDDLEVWAIPIQFQQVLMNLILNARDAMLSRGGTLKISAEDKSDSVCLQICDTGSGIKPADLENIFDLFFTTKKAAKKSGETSSGSGLGLAFCKKIMDEHHGQINVQSELGKSTVFKLTLPKAQSGNN